MGKESSEEKERQIRDVVKTHLLSLLQGDGDVRTALLILMRAARDEMTPKVELAGDALHDIMEHVQKALTKDLVRWMDLRPEAFTGAAAARFMAGRG